MTKEAPDETFISHLVELRNRIVRAALSVIVVFLVLMAYPGANKIYDILAMPMLAALPAGNSMIATGVISPFIVPIKVTMLVAFVLALPMVLYQAWSFIAPGLYKHEQKLALPIIASSTLLFLLGMLFCYFVVFRTVFNFMVGISPDSITMATDIEAYVSFVITMFIAFGVTFEVPIVVILLVKSGMISVEKLAAARGYVIVGAFVIAAVITPPDVLSQFMLAVPLCILFEIGLIIARMVQPKNETGSELDLSDN